MDHPRGIGEDAAEGEKGRGANLIPWQTICRVVIAHHCQGQPVLSGTEQRDAP